MSAQAQTTQPVEKSLTSLALNFTQPFYSHEEGHIERLEEAHALLALLSSAFEDNDDGGALASTGSFCGCRPLLKAKALEGVQTLIALALHQHALAVAEGGR